MSLITDAKDRIIEHLQPLILITFSVLFLTFTVILRPWLLLQPQKFRHEWFRRFFGFVGPRSAANPMHLAESKPLLAETHGVVLDIGPGLGDQLHLFRLSIPSINQIYGIEPTKSLHAGLTARANSLGLGSKYKILPAGASPSSMIPALQASGLDTSTPIFDRIVCIKSLCSAPQADTVEIISTFRDLLKPGGDFVFLEHVGNKTDTFTMWYQWVLDFVWPALMGGCRLDGRMEEVVKNMNGWRKVNVRLVEGSRGWESIPFVVGKAVKA